MHFGGWIVEVTEAWKFYETWELSTTWLLHNWLGCATYWLTGKVLVRLYWLFTFSGNCRGAAITFDSEATWIDRTLEAAGFKTVIWCCSSIRETVIESTFAEYTPVIVSIQWLDCRQLFSATVLSLLLGRCEVLFSTMGNQGRFCRLQFNSWLSILPFVPIWTWEGPKFHCMLVK